MKQLSEIVVTELPKSIEVKPVCWKARVPMLVTESGIVIEVKLEHSRKAFWPMVVTESGMVIEVKLVH